MIKGEETYHKNRLLGLLSSDELFVAAQRSFKSDWKVCWAILSYISKNCDSMMIIKNDGPDLDEMYGECLRLKINDLFAQGPGISHSLNADAKLAILLEVFQNLNFDDVGTPLAALLKHCTHDASLNTKEDASGPNSEDDPEPDWPWPMPDITSSRGNSTFAAKFADASALKLLGYSVGVNGLKETERKELLERFFTGPLPSIVDELFGDAWGNPGSEERLKKMADTISSNCKNFKRNDASKYRVAIEDWESDLSWLKENFYKRGRFPWPDTIAE